MDILMFLIINYWWVILLAIIVFGIIHMYIKTSPFVYPMFEYNFDISGKRMPDIDDYIDDFLIHGGMNRITEYEQRLKEWETKSREKLAKYRLLHKVRQAQFDACFPLDNNNLVFVFVRRQMRYKQKNYVRTSYYVDIPVEYFHRSISYVKDRDIKLRQIGYQCPLSQYFARDQRSKMTKQLRQQIKERDNYTCQICGKYMPDEVGLEIDHIYPIAKGGKSVSSNLQVLCSVCNNKKRDKILYGDDLY